MELSAVTLNQAPDPKNNRLIPVFIAAVVLLCLGVMIAMSAVKKNSTPGVSSAPTAGPSPTPTLIPHPTLGTMTMTTKDGQTRYRAGSPVTLIITASSEGKNIVGYDAILSYEAAGFTFQKAVSLPKDFQLYSYDRKTYVSFSGIRSLQSKVADTWSNYPLLEVTMTAKKSGKYTFELSPEGREVSKLVDDKAQVVYPKTVALHLEIY